MWKRFGRLHAIPVVLAFYAAAIVAALTLGDGAVWVAIALIALFVVYCSLRPRRGGDVFFAWLIPGPTSELARMAFDIPRWWIAAPLLVVSFAVLWHIERHPEDSWGAWGEKPNATRA